MCKAMEDMITDFVTDEKKLAAIRVLEGGKLTQEEIAEDLNKFGIVIFLVDIRL